MESEMMLQEKNIWFVIRETLCTIFRKVLDFCEEKISWVVKK